MLRTAPTTGGSVLSIVRMDHVTDADVLAVAALTEIFLARQRIVTMSKLRDHEVASERATMKETSQLAGVDFDEVRQILRPFGRELTEKLMR